MTIPKSMAPPICKFSSKRKQIFLQYKNFFIDSLKKNEIKVVYETSEEKYLNTKLIISEIAIKHLKSEK